MTHKYHYLVVIALLAALPVRSQETYTAQQGQGYQTDVFFSFANGIVGTAPTDNWDIAFDATGPFSIAIRINDGNNRRMAVYPNSGIEGWASVDTLGFHSWAKRTNQIDQWSNGAFNTAFSSDPMNFGWGTYTGAPLYQVIGDSIYIVERPDGAALKLRIDNLDNGVWNFTYADIDGSNEVSETLLMSDHPNRNFIYYDFSTGATVDREPDFNTWDMVFTRYVGPTTYGMFPTTGVLLNAGIAGAIAEGVDVETAEHTAFDLLDNNIGVVGNGWRVLDNFQWQMVSDLCYFVESQSGEIYKLIFTDFTGTSTGETTFTTEVVSGSNVTTVNRASTLQLYPNPSADGLITINGMGDANGRVDVEVYSIDGRLVLSTSEAAFGDQLRLNLSSLPYGQYLLLLRSAQAVDLLRFNKH